jgi:hypothetical protein
VNGWQIVAGLTAVAGGLSLVKRGNSVPKDVPIKPGVPQPGAPDPGTKSTSYPGTTGQASPPSSWTQMPAGPLWTIRNPARSWGTPQTIAALTAALLRYSERAPELGLGTTPVRVLDISKAGGGQFGAHKSHQQGRDVDLSFPGSVLEPVATPVLLRALLEDDAVQAIFLAWSVQEKIWNALEVNPELDPGGLVRAELQYPLAPGTGSTRVRHWPGHAKHLHVRYRA